MILYSYPATLSVVCAVRASDGRALDRVIAALKDQTLSKRHWRLTVVDQTAGQCGELAEKFLWHPKVTIVGGEAEGPATTAMRALLACRSDLVVYLDGRTCLNATFLETAIELASANPFVGIFGGPAEIADPGVTPTWQVNFMRLYGVRPVGKATVLQTPDRRYMPGPFGYVVRREHLRRFGFTLRNHPFFREAGFARQREDFDFRAGLARTVIEAGFSMGLFPELTLKRVVEHADLHERHIQEPLRKDAFSRIIERFVWAGLMPEGVQPSRWETLALRWLRTWQFDRVSRLRKSHRLGILNAVKLVQLHATRSVLVPSLSRPGVPTPGSMQTPA